MRHRLLSLIMGLAVLSSSLWMKHLRGQTASSESSILTRITPAWTTGIISDGVGRVRIIVKDLNQDGKMDIATCGEGYVYILNYTSLNTYDTILYSEYLACYKIAAADRDSDGIHELYVVTSDGPLLILKADNLQPIGRITLPSNSSANDVAVGNVDKDDSLEIVLSSSNATYVYDAKTLTLEWEAVGYGGGQVAIGNIDQDPSPEIVINGSPGSPAHVLDASQKAQKWAYSGGFGADMDLGDVDGDSQAEIAWMIDAYDVYVLDGDTRTIKWQRTNLGDLGSIRVFDVNQDGFAEVLIGNGWGNITGYQGNDGTQLWSIPNPENGAFGIGVGDANNNGSTEILWGTGPSYHPKVALLVGNWVTQTVEWGSDDLDGPLYAAADDVDTDGQSEIVIASHTTNGNSSGMVRIYDGKTHLQEWSTVVDKYFYNISQLAIGNLDSDSALEILVGGESQGNTHLQAYDGSSRTVDWSSTVLGGGGAPCAVKIMNLDGDAVDEIIVGKSNQHVQILNGASNVIEWDSGLLDGDIRDVSLGDLDGNGVIELAVLTNLSVYVIETGTWSQKLHRAVANGRQIVIANSDLKGPGELLLVIDSGNTLQAWDGMNYLILWQQSLGGMVVNDLTAVDLDSDASQEFILIGLLGGNSPQSSLLWIGSQSYPFLWESKMNRSWGSINSLALSDLDQDGQNELLFGSSAVIQENEISTSSLTIQRSYLPIISKRLSRLFGLVTEGGVAAAGISLDLRFYNGSAWSTFASTVTSNDGSYSFDNIPSLSVGQRYYVRYQNLGNSPNRLWAWHTQTLSSFNAGNEIRIGDFDLAGFELVSPANGATLSLPNTFYWTPRRFVNPTDSYEFNLYDPYNMNTYFYTDPPLGYTDFYVLYSPPPGFSTGTPYVWEMWVYSPDGGYGISFESRWVSFFNTGLSASIAKQPVQNKPAIDLEERR